MCRCLFSCLLAFYFFVLFKNSLATFTLQQHGIILQRNMIVDSNTVSSLLSQDLRIFFFFWHCDFLSLSIFKSYLLNLFYFIYSFWREMEEEASTSGLAISPILPLFCVFLPLIQICTHDLLSHLSCSSEAEPGDSVCLSKINLMRRGGEMGGRCRRWGNSLCFLVSYSRGKEKMASYYLSFPNSVSL